MKIDWEYLALLGSIVLLLTAATNNWFQGEDKSVCADAALGIPRDDHCHSFPRFKP